MFYINRNNIKTVDLDDLNLMALVMKGETDRMGILYERYKMQVYSYFYKVTCGDRETSEDLVHSVFYKAIRYRSSFGGHGSFANWLFRIAHNIALDHNRTMKIKNRVGFIEDSGSANKVVCYDNEFENREQIATLYRAMQRLEYEEREIIVLGKIECLKYREIGDILGLTETNVRIKMFRALKKLKDIFMKIENVSYEKERTQ